MSSDSVGESISDMGEILQLYPTTLSVQRKNALRDFAREATVCERIADPPGVKYHTDFNEVTHVAEAEMNPAIPLTIGIHFCRIPAGSQQAQTRDETPFDMPGKAGIKSRPAPTNDFEQRTTALDELFTSLVGGIPAIQLHPRCKFLVKGLVAEPRSEQELDEWHRELRAAMPEDIFE